MKIRRLTAQQTAKLWQAFFDAHGAEQMSRSYGWEHSPRIPRSGERVYAFGEGETVVAWGSLQLKTWDATDDEAAVMVGVFPEFQRRGLAQVVYAEMLRRAEHLGADYGSQVVFKDNEAQHAREMRRAGHIDCGCEGLPRTSESGWLHAGRFWHPAPSDYFVYPFGDDNITRMKKERA